MKCNFISLTSLALVLTVVLSACADNTPTSSSGKVTSPAVGSVLGSTATSAGTSVPPTSTKEAAATSTPTIKPEPPIIKAVMTNAEQVGEYDKIELTVDMTAAYSNPFDPTQVDLHGVFTAPNGKSVTVPGFYFQDYDSSQAGSSEILTPKGTPAWKVRFAATAIGTWSYYVEVVTPFGKAASIPAKLNVVASANPGYLQVNPQDHAYLQFSSGKPYFAIGENIGWYDKGGTYDYTKWFSSLKASGGNYARIWMADWAFGLEWGDTGLGNYTNRLDRAWQLDRVFDLVQQDNIYILLSLLNHGAFNTTTDAEWDKNPYNAALGGPCAHPQDFATNSQARQLFKQRLRYIAARWGYSTNLLAWEWWNEIDWTPLASTDLLKPWIAEMTKALQSWEPYPHLKTTSYAKSFDEQIYQMPEIDIVQRHEYSTKDAIDTFPQNMPALQAFGKPVLYGEYGENDEANTDSLDKTGIYIHNGQWASIMSKAAGTAMPWWWDSYIDPLNLYSLFSGPASFLQGENLANANYKPLDLNTNSDEYSALALQSDQKILGWVKSENYSFAGLKSQYEDYLLKALKNNQKGDNFRPSYTAISNASLTINNVAPGNYRVEWWNTQGKGILSTSNMTVKDSTLILPIPSFDQDLAFKLIK